MIYDFLMFMGIFMFLSGCSGDNNILNDKNPKESYNKLGWPYKALIWGAGLNFARNIYYSSVIKSTPTIYSIQIKGNIDNEMFLYVEERLRQIKNIGNASAIILDIDSGGGLVPPTIKIAKALEEFREKNGVEIYSMVYSGLCASGAYWIASVSNLIFATEDAVLGSIGVRKQLFNFDGILKKLGVKAETISGGEKKVTWDIFNENPKEATEDLKKEIEKIHDLFIDTTYRNRTNYGKIKVTKNKWKKICDGSTFLGNEIFGKDTYKELYSSNTVFDDNLLIGRNFHDADEEVSLDGILQVVPDLDAIVVPVGGGGGMPGMVDNTGKYSAKEKLADFPFIYKNEVYKFVQKKFSIQNDIQILPGIPVTSTFKSIFKKKEKRETGIQKLLTYNPKKIVM